MLQCWNLVLLCLIIFFWCWSSIFQEEAREQVRALRPSSAQDGFLSLQSGEELLNLRLAEVFWCRHPLQVMKSIVNVIDMEMKFWENVHPPNMSHVTCPVSRVTCHVSLFFSSSFFGPSGGAYWWRVCYQRSLPRLVFDTEGSYCKTFQSRIIHV